MKGFLQMVSLTYLSEPREERQGIVSTEGPGLTRCCGERIKARADAQYQRYHHHAHRGCFAAGASEEDLMTGQYLERLHVGILVRLTSMNEKGHSDASTASRSAMQKH